MFIITETTHNLELRDYILNLVSTNLKAIRVVSDKGTASADTMDQLFIEVGVSKTDVYYTVRTGTSPNYTYSWHKLDTDILDDLSISWSDVQDKPSTFTPSSHTHSEYVNPTIADNLTTDSSTQVLSAKMGKKLNDEKVAINQGTTNNGKFLKVSSGNVVCESVTVPSAGSSTPGADVSGGAVGSSSNYAKADHQHLLSSAYATSGHTHANMEVTTNKSSSITTDTGSTTKYTTVKAVEDYIDSIIGDIEEDMLA